MPGIMGLPSHGCGLFQGRSESVEAQPEKVRSSTAEKTPTTTGTLTGGG